MLITEYFSLLKIVLYQQDKEHKRNPRGKKKTQMTDMKSTGTSIFQFLFLENIDHTRKDF